jgi:hypothetical protein
MPAAMAYPVAMPFYALRFNARFDDPWLDRLAALGEAQDRALHHGAYTDFERLHHELIDLYGRREKGTDFASKLSLLYDHDNPQVRWIAAVWSYPFAPEAARRALKKLAESEFCPQCIFASFAGDSVDHEGLVPELEPTCLPHDGDPDIEPIHTDLMEFTDFASLTLKQLIERFVGIGIAQEYAQENDELGKFNELFHRAREAGAELRTRGNEACEALEGLYSHSCARVRLNAATQNYELAPEGARKCVQGMASIKGFSPELVSARDILSWMDKHPKSRN